MKILRAALLTMALVSTAVADEGWRVGNKLVLVGDSMAKVLQVAGQPDIRNRIESEQGGTVGNRWYYVQNGYDAKTIIITFQGGRVVSIETEKD